PVLHQRPARESDAGAGLVPASAADHLPVPGAVGCRRPHRHADRHHRLPKRAGRMKRGLIRRWVGDERGVSAIEFAMIAPVLIVFYMGMTEFCQGFMAQKRMGHVSATVADLIAQEETITS